MQNAHTMTEATLKGRRILVVEDEFFLASCLTDALADIGAIIIGPVGMIAEAVAIISAEPIIHGAILDLNLHGKMTFDVADHLILRKIAFVFTTGYDISVVPARLKHIALCQKPLSTDTVLHAIAQAIHDQSGYRLT